MGTWESLDASRQTEWKQPEAPWVTIYGKCWGSVIWAWAGRSALRSLPLVRSTRFGRFKVTIYGTLCPEMLLRGPVRGRKREVR